MKLSNKSWHVTKIIHLRISTFNLCGNSMMYQPFCTHKDHMISRMWIFLSGPSRSYGNYNVCLSVFPLQQQSLLTSAACLSHFLVGSVIAVLVKYLSTWDKCWGQGIKSPPGHCKIGGLCFKNLFYKYIERLNLSNPRQLSQSILKICTFGLFLSPPQPLRSK